MPLVLPGSAVIGPRAAAVPATMLAYLTSIGKASMFGRFVDTSGLAPNADGSGGAVAIGGAWGCWSPIEQVNFNFKFIQSTSASRPAWGTNRDGRTGVYGNGSSWFATLNSSTALNGGYTVLVSSWEAVEAGGIWSHNSLNNALMTVTSGPDNLYAENSLVIGGQVPQAWNSYKSGANIRQRVGWSTTSTLHNGFAPDILRRSNGVWYSSSTIFEIVVCPVLTMPEIRVALGYMA